MRSVQLALLGAALVAATPAAAAENFLGSTLNAQYYFPNTGSPFSDSENFTVTDPGVELTTFPNGDPRTNIDFTATSILITYLSSSTWTATDFNGFIIRDLSNNLAAITSVSIDPSSNFAGFGSNRLTFDANSIAVNWQGLAFSPSTTLRLNVGFGSAVPEPSTWAMMLLGFGAIGVAARRRRQRPQLARAAA